MKEALPKNPLENRSSKPWELADLKPELARVYELSKMAGAEHTQRLHTYYENGQSLSDVVERYEAVLPIFLKKYGIEAPIEQVRPGLYRISVPSAESLPNLPDGYAYIGGTARAALEQALGIENPSTPRDYDVVRLIADPESPEDREKVYQQDQKLSETIMHDDYVRSKGKHGVKPIEDDYFASRDFTVNEVLLDGEYIYCTTACLIDTVRGYIRPSEHNLNENPDNIKELFLPNKIAFKALRLAAEYKNREQLGKISIPHANMEISCHDSFYLALQLDKAFEQGGDVPKHFLQYLHENKAIPEHVETVDELLMFATRHQSVFRKAGFFRHAPTDLVVTEAEFVTNVREAANTYPDWYSQKLARLPKLAENDEKDWFDYLRKTLVEVNIADRQGSDVCLPLPENSDIFDRPVIDNYYPGNVVPFHLLPVLKAQLLMEYDRFRNGGT